MEIVKERRNASNLTRYYRVDELTDSDAMISRLCDIRKTENLNISYILLSDLMNRSDEGSDNLRLSGNVDIEEFQNEVRQRNIDVISMNGTYKDKPVVIGAKLLRREIYITIRLSNKADIDAFEKEIKL